MAKQLSMEEICEQLTNLERKIRDKAIRDIADDLEEFAAPAPGFTDTFAAGWAAAVEFIRANY